MSLFQRLQHQDFPENWSELDQLYRKWNYELCNAANLTSLGATLNRMVSSGRLSKEEADHLDMQGRVLRDALIAANKRCFPEVAEAEKAAKGKKCNCSECGGTGKVTDPSSPARLGSTCPCVICGCLRQHG